MSSACDSQIIYLFTSRAAARSSKAFRWFLTWGDVFLGKIRWFLTWGDDFLFFSQPRSSRSTFGFFLVGGKKAIGFYESDKLAPLLKSCWGKQTIDFFEYQESLNILCHCRSSQNIGLLKKCHFLFQTMFVIYYKTLFNWLNLAAGSL